MKLRAFAILALHAKVHKHLDNIEIPKVEVKTEAVVKPIEPKPDLQLESLKKEVLAIHFV